MALQHYISNPSLSDSSTGMGVVSLKNDFIFSTKVIQKDKTTFNLKFHIRNEDESKEYIVSLSNTNFDGNYILTDSYITSSARLNPVLGKHSYFYESFVVKSLNGKYYLYKLITDKDSPTTNWLDYFKDDMGIYAYTEDDIGYALVYKNNNYYIEKTNKLRADGSPIKPTLIKSISNGTTTSSEILYDENNVFDSNDDRWYRFIVSQNASLVTLWIKNDNEESYKKVKTFSFQGEIEKAGFKLSFDENMELNDLSFSFFKSDII